MVFIKVPCYFNLQKNSLISKVSESCDLGILGLRGPVVEERLIIAMLTFLAALVVGGGGEVYHEQILPWVVSGFTPNAHCTCSLQIPARDCIPKFGIPDIRMSDSYLLRLSNLRFKFRIVCLLYRVLIKTEVRPPLVAIKHWISNKRAW